MILLQPAELPYWGSGDKDCVAEIMHAANYLITHPEVKHGSIKLLFTQ